MPNIKDVAAKANVGIGTVSRVLNNSDKVSLKTRKKVERVIKELGYIPNQIARNMTNQKSNIIGFIVPFSNHVFFAELIFHVENALSNLNYKLMVCNSGSDPEKELELIGMLKKNQVDGIIFLTSNDIDKEIPRDYPVISFDRRFKGIPFIASDNYAGGQLAAKTLIDAGAKNLLFIGDDAQGELSSIETEVSKRRRGFVDYLNEHNIKNYKIVEYPQGNIFLPKSYIKSMIQDLKDIDGIFAISDELGHTIVNHLSKKGIQFPKDIKLIAYDGIENPFLDMTELTSIKQPVKEMAEIIAEKLVKRIHGEPIEDTILPITLKLGETT
jgi:DNA-binding LacI/PurR family transcriptional regulator